MKRCPSIDPAVAWLLVLLAGCSSSSNSVQGSTSVGGKTYPTGGATYVAAGGNTAVNGNPDAGLPVAADAGTGIIVTGGESAAGGMSATGGVIAMGGESAAGGASYAAGGASGLGGATAAAGGASGFAGATKAAGGAPGMGGSTSGAGGATGTGIPPTGGAVPAGGTPSGGATSPPASSTTSAGGSLASGGRTTGADAGVTTAPPDAFASCTVNISAPSLLNLVSGASATLTVQGTLAWGSSTPTQPNWQWTVRGPDGTLLTTTPTGTSDTNTQSVQFPLLTPGNYDISVSATPACKGQASATAVKPQDRSQAFFLRVLPPSVSAGSGQTCTTDNSRWCPTEDAVPYEDANFTLQASQPRQDTVQLLHGYMVSIDPMTVAQPTLPAVAVPSFVRASPHGSTWTIDGASTTDQAMSALLHPALTYDVLVVPQAGTGPQLPPFLVPPKLAQGFRPSDFDVAAGVTLTGTLSGPSGPAAGARMLLHADANPPVTLPLPSTVGVATATGTYSLSASAGTLFSAVVVPPSGTAWPQVTIANGIDLRGSANGASLAGVNFTWNAISTTTLTLRVFLSDGSTSAGSGVTVRLQSQDGAFPNAGSFTVAGVSTSATSGTLRQDGTTDASGSVVFSNIPKIAYAATLVPPSGLAGAALTTTTISLSGATATSARSVNLARKVQISGHVLPAAAASGAQLVVTDTGTDVIGNVISTVVASDGSYQFLADPLRTYSFLVQPVAGQNLPTRIPIYGVTTTTQDTQLPDRTLPSGLLVSGVVSFAGQPVSGAMVQAYCEQSGVLGCVDPNNPYAALPLPLIEFATLPDGSYSFYLLDPANGG